VMQLLALNRNRANAHSIDVTAFVYSSVPNFRGA
jgi:hypothetical protein